MIRTQKISAATCRASLIVVTHNDARWLGRFMESVLAQTAINELEVVFVDNESVDGCAGEINALERNYSFVTAVHSGGDLGYGVGCNIGARAASGKYFFFLNPDVWLEPKCVSELLTCASQSGSSVTLACAEMKYDSNELICGHHGQGAAGFDVFGCPCMPLRRTGTTPESWPAPEPFVFGSFSFMERNLFEAIGGFDPEFFLYGEEMDLAWRARLAGSEIQLCAGARLHHAAGGSSIQSLAPLSALPMNRRHWANRNQLLAHLKCAQHFLLLLAFNYFVLMAAEAVVIALLTRKISVLRDAVWRPLSDLWRLRSHIASERARLNRRRVHGDFYFLRFLKPFTFGHWIDARKFLVPIKRQNPAGAVFLGQPGGSL